MPSRTLPVPRAIEAQGARIKELEENQRDLLKIVRLNEDFLLALDRNHEGLTKQVEKMVSYQEWLGQNLLKLEAVVDEHIGTALSRMCAGASDTKPATPPEETSGGDETPRAKTTSSGEQAQLDDSSARRNTEMTELVRILEVFKRTESGIEGVREEVAALAADLNTLSKEDDEETKSLPDERFDYEKGLADIANSLRAAPVVQSGSATKEPGRMRVTREYHDREIYPKRHRVSSSEDVKRRNPEAYKHTAPITFDASTEGPDTSDMIRISLIILLVGILVWTLDV